MSKKNFREKCFPIIVLTVSLNNVMSNLKTFATSLAHFLLEKVSRLFRYYLGHTYIPTRTQRIKQTFGHIQNLNCFYRLTGACLTSTLSSKNVPRGTIKLVSSSELAHPS